MAISAFAYELQVIGQSGNGSALVQVRFHLSDTLRDPVKAETRSLTVQLDAEAPNQYTQQVRNAIIADAATLNPPIVVNAADITVGFF